MNHAKAALAMWVTLVGGLWLRWLWLELSEEGTTVSAGSAVRGVPVLAAFIVALVWALMELWMWAV